MRRSLLPALMICVLFGLQPSFAKETKMLFDGILNIPLKKNNFTVDDCGSIASDKIVVTNEATLECLASRKKNILDSLHYYVDAFENLGFLGGGFGPNTLGHYRGCRGVEAIEIFGASLVDLRSLGTPAEAHASGRMKEYMDGMRLLFVYNPGGCENG